MRPFAFVSLPISPRLAVIAALGSALAALVALPGPAAYAATYTVTNVSDSGAGTLRQAIVDANASGTPAVIAFNISGCPCTISPASALPTLTKASTTIDGTTQPGYNGSAIVTLDGTLAGAGVAGLSLNANDLTVKGLGIQNFSGAGINAITAKHNNLTITSDMITGNTGDGVEANITNSLTLESSTASGNGGIGVNASFSPPPGMTSVVLDSNTITDNTSDGIEVPVSGTLTATNNSVSHNHVGINAAYGTMATATFDSNTITDNTSDGIEVPVSVTLTATNNSISFNGQMGINAAYATVATATFDSNTIAGNASDGVGVSVSGTLVVTNNSISSNGQKGVNATYAGASGGNIAGNTVLANGTDGIALAGNGLGVHFNRILSSGVGVRKVDGSALDAENNWWGCNAGPGAAGCASVAGSVTAATWLVLGLSASPGSIFTGQQSTLTADLTKNSIGADTSGSGHIQDGTSVLFATDLGSVGSPSVSKPTAGGKAAATLQANGGPGTANITVTLDNQTVNGQVTVTPAPSPTPSAHLQGDLNCDGVVSGPDALRPLRVAVGLAIDQPLGCPRLDSGSPQFGDVNCDGSVDGGDTVAILQFAVHVAINPSQHAGCTPIGETLP